MAHMYLDILIAFDLEPQMLHLNSHLRMQVLYTPAS